MITVRQFRLMGAFVMNAPIFLSHSTPARAGGRFTDSLSVWKEGCELVRFTVSLDFHRKGCEVVRFTDSLEANGIGSEVVK